MLGLFLGYQLLSTGCVTQPPLARAYEEEIDSIALPTSRDSPYILVVGRKYGYMLRAPFELTNALRSPLRPQLSAAFSNFELIGPQVLQGNWHLRLLRAALSEELESSARKLGFREEGEQFVLRGAVQVTRLDKDDPARTSRSTEPLNRSYVIPVGVSKDYVWSHAASERHPVVLVGEGVIRVGLVLFAPITLPLFILKALPAAM
jgi:hypothetical protein